MLRTATRRLCARIFQQVQRPSSSAPIVHSDKPEDGQKPFSDVDVKSKKISEEAVGEGTDSTRSKLVTAAFASLKQNQPPQKTSLDDRISAAKDPETLLSLSQTSSLSKKQILRIVTTLAEWSVSGQADMLKYETDPRFVSLCRLLGKTPKRSPALQTPNKAGDLSLVLDVTGDDEAAKLISSITLPQMIKVMVSLGFKKRRSVPLLRALSFNITNSSTLLDIKQGADIMYALASLNFPDEILMEKACCDMLENISKCQKTSVIGSISTSLGLLKYKDENLLDALVEWAIKNHEIIRFQDMMALLITLASVNYVPRTMEHFFKVTKPLLNSKETPTCNAWLDVVWSLAVCDIVEPGHIQSVLNADFIDKLNSVPANASNFSWKKKLLNINGVARYTSGYKGPFLDETLVPMPLARSKDKQVLVSSVVDALSNLVPSGTYLRTDVDSGMGFLIDAECLIDEKMTPLPLVDKKTGEPIVSQKPKRGRKVAVMVWDFHDLTKGKATLCGSAALSSELLKKAGYEVLNVSHKDYNFRDKLTDRVRFIERQLKGLIVKE